MKIRPPRLFTFVLVLILVLATVPLASAASAAASPSLTPLKVVPGASVTIRARDFPAGQLFNVRMDFENSISATSPLVDVTNSGAGGTFDETYKIPVALKSEARIAIRFDSAAGVVVSAVFANSAEPTAVSTIAPTSGIWQITPIPGGSQAGKPHISVIAGVKGQAITVHAVRFPEKQNFLIRVGPYDSFYRDYVILGRLNSGTGGTFDFVLALPTSLKDVTLLTIRLDGGAYSAYNAFTNQTFGPGVTPAPGTGGSGPTPTPISTLKATPTPVTILSTSQPTALSGACQVISVSPSAAVAAGSDVDAVWTVKNTSAQAWDARAVDYRFVSGSAMHKKSAYDLGQTVQPGASVQIIVDMRAPSSVGSYSENWVLSTSTSTLCNLAVTLTVR